MTPSTIGENELRTIMDGLEGVTPGPWLSALWAGSPSTGPDAGILSGPKMVARDKSTLHTPEDASHIARLDPDTVRAIVTLALEALDRRKDGLGTVSVKLPTFDKYGEAKGASAKYTVYEGGSGLWNAVCYPYEESHFRLAEGVTHPEAIAACQSDFETRVKSCLTSIGVEAGKWQTIDSAPKDGTVILAVASQAQTPKARPAWWDGEGWVRIWKSEDFVQDGPRRWWPSHWQPMPSFAIPARIRSSISPSAKESGEP